MRDFHARWPRLRAGLLLLMVASVMAGCGGDRPSSAGTSSSTDPKAGARRNEQKKFYENQASGEKK